MGFLDFKDFLKSENAKQIKNFYDEIGVLVVKFNFCLAFSKKFIVLKLFADN
ncbi:hypothetical protein AVBRAN12640_08400 [Campylobacter sp. RM12640]|uniref:hypothetical protein n=1 Tax=unclassified Campylobacter TaxID=2593542 RepID=UPI001D7DDDAC|nr:hypothetical protein [Campylobacter sp. RM12640]MBZ7989800.1 hypothetical protein [Campylobacter sp. RM12635]MBZ7993259.1 hypothetical protein [Campylobacter sp. RM9333]